MQATCSLPLYLTQLEPPWYEHQVSRFRHCSNAEEAALWAGPAYQCAPGARPEQPGSDKYHFKIFLPQWCRYRPYIVKDIQLSVQWCKKNRKAGIEPGLKGLITLHGVRLDMCARSRCLTGTCPSTSSCIDVLSAMHSASCRT
jgi:hypothetical protein